MKVEISMNGNQVVSISFSQASQEEYVRLLGLNQAAPVDPKRLEKAPNYVTTDDSAEEVVEKLSNLKIRAKSILGPCNSCMGNVLPGNWCIKCGRQGTPAPRPVRVTIPNAKPHPLKGRKMSAETRAKISKSRRRTIKEKAKALKAS